MSYKNEYTFIELFAGAGGFSVGLEMAGFRRIAAVEIDRWACETLRANSKTGLIIEKDICQISNSEIKTLEIPDVIVGGPPCQGFSVAGPSQYGVEDPRNNLFLQFLRFVDLLRPIICVIENVPNIYTKNLKGGITAACIIKDLFGELGYNTINHTFNAADYGVPQSRKRAFIVAMLNGGSFNAPTKICKEACNQLQLFDVTRPYLTAWEALSDLPAIHSSEGEDGLVPYDKPPANSYQELMRKGSEGVYNHIAMRHTERLVERFKSIPVGKSLKDVSLEHGQKQKFTGKISKKPYKSNNQRLDPDQVCLAIPASFQSNFVHPYLHRNLTAREAARLMSFPDNYVFKGKRTTMSWEPYLSQYNQIGNAVCPLLAKAVGESIAQALDNYSFASKRKRNKISEKLKTWLYKTAPKKFSSKHLFIDKDPLLKNELSFLGAILLKNLGLSFNDDLVFYKNLQIPFYYFPLALIISTNPECKICDKHSPPYANHNGFMPFLISKDEFESLSIKQKDNGLDYHLRYFDRRPYQCAHYVGEILEKAGFAKLLNDKNPRTGRFVRGMVVEKLPNNIERLREKFNDGE